MLLDCLLFPPLPQKRSPPIAWGACCCKCALVGSRTPNLLIRSQVLYPIELRVQYRASKVAFGRPKAGANIIRPALTRLVILHSLRHVGVQVGDAALVAGMGAEDLGRLGPALGRHA